MFPIPGFTLADQLIWIVDCFLRAMRADACTRRLGSLSFAIWVRVKGLERRFCTLYGLWKAGRVPAVRGRRGDTSPRPSPQSREGERTPTPIGPLHGPIPRLAGEGANGAGGANAAPFDPQANDAASLDRVRTRPMSVLPRRFRWLQKLLPMSAPALAGGVESLLWNYPEMKEFVADCPQAGRILRPLCTMAGLKVPEWLALPKRVRKKAALRLSEEHEAELARLTARFPDTPPARAAKRVLRRMFAGLPVNWEGLSDVARGYVMHPPRDDNCPPPEIGYGGRWRRPPKDYAPPRDWE